MTEEQDVDSLLHLMVIIIYYRIKFFIFGIKKEKLYGLDENISI